jgi:hypothetical protein
MKSYQKKMEAHYNEVSLSVVCCVGGIILDLLDADGENCDGI